jgi:hypothetical protein
VRAVNGHDGFGRVERDWNRNANTSRNLLITHKLEVWRRGESEYSGLLKIRKLLIFRAAKNAENGKIAPSWNVSGTRDSNLFILRKKEEWHAPAL